MICRVCNTREATCRVTERQADGTYLETRSCETCLNEAVPASLSLPKTLPPVEMITRMISGLHVLGGPSVSPHEAARMACAFVDHWERRNPPSHRPD